jgi:outer membrane receptor protein involved in Fe transport
MIHALISARRSVLFAVCFLALASAFAQAASRITGRLVNSISGEPIANASVTIDELKQESTITARLDNAANELYRNHLSLIKDLTPEMGRNFKLLYNVKF